MVMNTNTRMSPKDFFLHLGATIALYATTIALINLAFEILNRSMPDTLANYFSSSSVVWPISMLVVITPILYVLEILINRDLIKMPEKRDIWIRKWRIYLTLFLTGVTIAVDIIVLVNTYLNGEISSRFIWKVVVVLIVSAVIFAYYILAKNIGINAPSMIASNSKKTWLAILVISGIVLVLAGIVAGFVIVGSPSTQRSLRFDQQRISDLNNIQYQIINYWQRVGALPPSLEALNDPISNFQIPADPETGKPYEYISLNKDPHAFGLCATFDLPSVKSDVPLSYPIPTPEIGYNSWTHDSGHVCFERTIDPKLYPLIKNNQ